MVDVLQKTTQGFKTSVNQRVDGELCLIQLCQPGLSLEAGNLSARIGRLEAQVTEKLSRMEQRFRAGEFTLPPEAEEQPETAEAPQLPEESSEEPETPEPPKISSDQAWLQIREQVLPEIDMIIRPFVAKLEGAMRGDRLILTPLNDTIAKMVNKPEVLACIRQKAAVVLGKTVGVQMGAGGTGIGDDPLKALAGTVKEMDNITIRE